MTKSEIAMIPTKVKPMTQSTVTATGRAARGAYPPSDVIPSPGSVLTLSVRSSPCMGVFPCREPRQPVGDGNKDGGQHKRRVKEDQVLISHMDPEDAVRDIT